jgi:glycosyltransferase involved in cell wall biosynthesis
VFGPEQATGIIVPPKDPQSLVSAIDLLLRDDALRGRMGENAVKDAEMRFDLRQQVDRYLTWYQELLNCNDSGSNVSFKSSCST